LPQLPPDFFSLAANPIAFFFFFFRGLLDQSAQLEEIGELTCLYISKYLLTPESLVYHVAEQKKNKKKNGPEEGQYFHVPLALCMGYETREEFM